MLIGFGTDAIVRHQTGSGIRDMLGDQCGFGNRFDVGLSSGEGEAVQAAKGVGVLSFTDKEDHLNPLPILTVKGVDEFTLIIDGKMSSFVGGDNGHS